MSLRNKLSRLEQSERPPRPALLDDLRARIRATLERAAARRAPAPPPEPLDAIDLPFASTETALGPLHVRTQRLCPGHRAGRAPLAAARDASAELLALLALDPQIADCDPRGALYLDTETTGLAGGTGTVAFLVGLAYWDGPSLVLEQLLVRALGQEAPVLERVRERIAAASMLVTFNGKSFDMPLLRTRFVMARAEAPREPPHLDLLHVARRIHGSARFGGGCRLVEIESRVLGFERQGDIESADVGAAYWHFLRTGDARAIGSVAEHNAWDVTTMAALVGVYGEPLGHEGFDADDLAGVARTLRRAGSIERAQVAADAALDRARTTGALRVRAEIAKARGDRARALADFEALVGMCDDACARLQLAKLYEHYVKDPARALTLVEQGTGESPERARRRHERLVRLVRLVQSHRSRQ